MTPEEQAAADAATAEAALGWRAKLPEDLREESSLVDFKDETEMISMPVNVAKSFVHTKKMVGADTYKMPSTDEEFSAHYDRFGRPESANHYVLPVPETENAKLKEMIGKDSDWFKETAHKHGLSDKQATGIFGEFASRVVTDVGSMEQTSVTEALNVEATMRTEYGPGYDGKMVLVKRAMNELGGNEFTQLLATSGIDKTATFQRAAIKIADMMAEDLGLDKQTGLVIMSKATVMEEITDLMKKPEYLDNTKPGHKELFMKVQQLMQQAHGTKPIQTTVASTIAP